MGAVTGVYPVFNNVFKIGADKNSAKTVADMESFSVAIDGNVEEWTPMEQEGWVRRLKTGCGITISLSGKRNIGDSGNDFVAGLAYKTGQASEAYFEWVMPDGTTIAIENAVINVTAGGGDSTNVEPLEFEVMSNGKPTITTTTATEK